MMKGYKTLPITKSDTKMSVKHHIASVKHNLSHASDHISPGVTDRLKGLQKINPKVASQQAKIAASAVAKVAAKIKPFTLPSAKIASKL